MASYTLVDGNHLAPEDGSYPTMEEGSYSTLEKVRHGIPRINLELWDHKLLIAVHWTILFISSGVLPSKYPSYIAYLRHYNVT